MKEHYATWRLQERIFLWPPLLLGITGRRRKVHGTGVSLEGTLLSEPDGMFHVMEMMTKERKYPDCDSFRDIGWYRTIDELLENCQIGEEPFRSVITSPGLVILSRD